jgi:hypothetical protein
MGGGRPVGGHDHGGHRAVGPLAPSPIDDSRAAVVEIPDDDVPPPGWDQWVSLPAPAPESPTVALVVRGHGGATLGGPANGARASSSHAALPASGGPAAHPEQEREHAFFGVKAFLGKSGAGAGASEAPQSIRSSEEL